jgi:hypothetical protein
MLGDSFLDFTDKHKSQRLLRLFGRNPKLVQATLVVFLFGVLPLLLAMSLFETYLLGRTAIGGHSLKPDAHALTTGSRILAGSLILVTLMMAWVTIRMMHMLWRVRELRRNLPPKDSSGGSGGSRVPRPPTGRPPVLSAAAEVLDTLEK